MVRKNRQSAMECDNMTAAGSLRRSEAEAPPPSVLQGARLASLPGSVLKTRCLRSRAKPVTDLGDQNNLHCHQPCQNVRSRPLSKSKSCSCSHYSTSRDFRNPSLLLPLLLFAVLFHPGFAQDVDLSKVPTPPEFLGSPFKQREWFLLQLDLSANGNHTVGLADVPRSVLDVKTLPCVAKGYPEPEYIWKKDGKILNETAHVILSQSDGNLTLKRLSKADVGVYQCLAKNDNGTAASPPINLNLTYTHQFPQKRPRTHVVSHMHPFEQTCQATLSNPKAKVYWMMKGDQHESRPDFNSVNKSHISIVSLDDKSTIYFSYVSKADIVEKLFYTCCVQNTAIEEYRFGEPFTFNVTGKRTDQRNLHPAEKQYVNDGDVKTTVGGNVRMHCIYSGFPEVVPLWSKVNGKIDSARATHENHGRTLVIKNVTESDGGKYRCKLPSKIDGHRSHDFDVDVQAKPYFAVEPKNKNISVGDDATFKCGIAGKPNPKITYYKNGEPLQPDAHTRILDNGHVLKITNAQKGEDGTGQNAVYQCKGENEHGIIWRNFYLHIIEMAPTFFGFGKGDYGSEDNPVRFVEGKAAVVDLNIFASPEPTLKVFHKPSKEVPETTTAPPRRETTDADGNEIVTITAVDKDKDKIGDKDDKKDDDDDEPVFVLIDVGDPDHPDNKDDYRKRKEEEAKDHVWVRDKETNQVMGLKVKEVDPKDGGAYKVEAENKNGKQEATMHARTIDKIQFKSNPLDKFKDHKKGKKGGYIVKGGERLVIPMEIDPADGIEHTITWYVDDEPLTPQNAEDYGIKFDGNGKTRKDLVIESPTPKDHTGNYTVIVKSLFDNATVVIPIEVAEVPMPPIYVNMSCKQNGTMAVVYWKHLHPSESMEPTSFIVEYSPQRKERKNFWVGPQDEHPMSHPYIKEHGFKDTVTITLAPYGTYIARVRTRNEYGVSAPTVSEPPPCKTAPTQPRKELEGIVLVPSGPGAFKATWEKQHELFKNGPDFKYYVKYRKKPDHDADITSPGDDDGTHGWKNMTFDDTTSSGPQVFGDHQSAVIDNLEPYKDYEVKVGTQNALGPVSVDPKTLTVKTGSDPIDQVPQGFLVSAGKYGNIAEFTWQPINKTKIVGDFKGYKIVYWHEEPETRYRRRKRAAGQKKTAEFDPDATSGTIYSFAPNAVNYAQIMAYSDAGDGKPSEPKKLVTGGAPPTAPRKLQVFALDEGQLHVKWVEPAEKNGIFVGYDIKFYKVSVEESAKDDAEEKLADEPAFEETLENPAQAELRVKELEPDTTYQVQLRGRTKDPKGEQKEVMVGPPAKNSKKTVPLASTLVAGDPEKPLVTVVSGIEDDEGFPVAKVVVQPGEYDKEKNIPVGQRIGVRYRPKGDKEWSGPTYGANDSLNINVTDLKPGTDYEIQAVSERLDEEGNIVGESYSPFFSYLAPGDPCLSPECMTLASRSNSRDEPITAAWIIAIIVIIIILIIILIICCLLIRNKGAKYPVQEKEKAQGREPMLPADKGFGEYSKPVDEEKMSLTGQMAAPSETDSMAEYGDGDPGKFTEDGSFIGQYAAPSKYPQIPAEARRPPDSQTSPLTTFA